MIPVPPSAGPVSAFSFRASLANPLFPCSCPIGFLGNLSTSVMESRPSLFYSFLRSVQPHRPTGKIRCLLAFLVVINCPNRLSRCQNPSTESPERYLRSRSAADRSLYKISASQHCEFASQPWFLSEDCLHPPFQLNDASLGASEVEKGSKKHL